MSNRPKVQPRTSQATASRETRAFVNLFKGFELSQSVKTLADLKDGRALLEVLSLVDPTVFTPTKSAPLRSTSSSDWVADFTSLKKLLRSLDSYRSTSPNLPQPQAPYDPPNVQLIAKNGDERETLGLCRLAIAVSVQATPGNEVVIAKIQTLSTQDQEVLMLALGPYLPKNGSDPTSPNPSASSLNPDSTLSDARERERSQESEVMEKAYRELMEEHRLLKIQLDEVTTERETAQVELSETRDAAGADAAMRMEIEKLKDELRRSEDNLGETEGALETQTRTLETLTRKVEELSSNTSEVAKLRDQLDELKHTADRLQKAESANKKLNRKLEESADLKRQLKSLEEENAGLVDRNAAIEEENKKIGNLKPLADSYKAQLADLENRERTRLKENTELQYELDQTRSRLTQAETELTSTREEIELNQERVRELELLVDPSSVSKSARSRAGRAGDGVDSLSGDDDAGDADADGLGDELDDAIQGSTKTGLKLQIRSLQRQLANPTAAASSRIIVLESLLEDARRMKDRYERDYLDAHKEALVLKGEMEALRNGEGAGGDGKEANVALRMRLNECVEEGEDVKKRLAELVVEHATISQKLTIAQSNLTLIDKDQIDVLNTLRASVNEEKADLEVEAKKLKDQIAEMAEKNAMQMGQINSLLLEKVGLQAQGIGAREAMLERERAFGDLRVSLAGRDIPEDVETKLFELQETNLALEAASKALEVKVAAHEEKLLKAKKFIREQDATIKDMQKRPLASLSGGGDFTEAEASYEKQIEALKDDNARLKSNLKELHTKYSTEYQKLLSALVDMKAKGVVGYSTTAQNGAGGAGHGEKGASWLAQQRRVLAGGLQR